MVPMLCLLALPIEQPVSWTGSPAWQSEGANAPHVRTVFHKVDIFLTKDTVTYRAKTLYKNTGDKGVSGLIMLPVIGNGGDESSTKTDVKASWGGIAVPASVVTFNLGRGGGWTRSVNYKLTLGPGEWKPFESVLIRPMNKSGEGWAERS